MHTQAFTAGLGSAKYTQPAKKKEGGVNYNRKLCFIILPSKTY